MPHPTDRITHTTAFFTPVVGHWLKREIAQWVHPMKDRSDDTCTMSERSYHGATARSRFVIKQRRRRRRRWWWSSRWRWMRMKLRRCNAIESGRGGGRDGEAGDVLVAPLFYFIFYFFPNYYLFIYYYLFFSKPLVSMIRQCSPPPHTHTHTYIPWP